MMNYFATVAEPDGSLSIIMKEGEHFYKLINCTKGGGGLVDPRMQRVTVSYLYQDCIPMMSDEIREMLESLGSYDRQYFASLHRFVCEQKNFILDSQTVAENGDILRKTFMATAEAALFMGASAGSIVRTVRLWPEKIHVAEVADGSLVFLQGDVQGLRDGYQRIIVRGEHAPLAD